MPTAIKKTNTKTAKKNTESEVVEKLEKALESFKEILGEKKFNNRIKKASKLFVKGTEKKAKTPKAAPASKKSVNPQPEKVKKAIKPAVKVKKAAKPVAKVKKG